MLDVAKIRAEFPILSRKIRGRPLVYLDSAASAQRPRAVIDAISGYYEQHHSNVHRGVHTLSQEATDLFEGAREKVRRFLHAASTREVVFVRGTTEAINLVAQSWGSSQLGPGDEVLITWLEHHANIVPWQQACARTGATLRVIPIDRQGVVDQQAFREMLGPRTRMLAISHVSNALGTVLPVREMVAAARELGVTTLVDGAQGVPHGPVDVQALGCDFYCFSGHKLYGPTGIGVLYAREAVLAQMPPWQGGGDMILNVSFEGTTYNELPYRFEAGTPNIAGAVGLGAAIDWFGALDHAAVAGHEATLLAHATERLQQVPGLSLVGTAPGKASVVSFTIDGIHPHDLGTILDSEGVAIRTGHHCAMPVMKFFDLPATARASFAVYNTTTEVDALVDALRVAREMLG
ncbi:MAG: cysteine desulfurase [Steroidobacteraceae bacterium]